MAVTVALHIQSPEALEDRVAEIFEQCERAIGLQGADPKFRADIEHAVRACYQAHLERVNPEQINRHVYWGLPDGTIKRNRRLKRHMLSMPASEFLTAAKMITRDGGKR